MNTPEYVSPEQNYEARKVKRLEVIGRDAPSKRKLFEKVFRGEASPRQAIKAFCLECIGFEIDEIRRCSAPTCPLRAYRPYMNGGAK